MEIGATKVVQDRLKTTKIEESKGASLVFCWDTHLTKIKGRNVLFIVNASNRYTIRLWFFIITGSYRRKEPFRSSHYPVLYTLA